VDDNTDLAESTAVLLDLYGYTARVAYSGEEALAAVAADPPDVAVVDIMMPRMDGFELTRRLRAVCGGKLFVVIASGCGTPDDVQRSREAGANLHLLKPVDPAALSDILQAHRQGALVAT
jgi:CheY-like chemotaxis protein